MVSEKRTVHWLGRFPLFGQQLHAVGDYEAVGVFGGVGDGAEGIHRVFRLLVFWRLFGSCVGRGSAFFALFKLTNALGHHPDLFVLVMVMVLFG